MEASGPGAYFYVRVHSGVPASLHNGGTPPLRAGVCKFGIAWSLTARDSSYGHDGGVMAFWTHFPSRSLASSFENIFRFRFRSAVDPLMPTRREYLSVRLLSEKLGIDLGTSDTTTIAASLRAGSQLMHLMRDLAKTMLPSHTIVSDGDVMARAVRHVTDPNVLVSTLRTQRPERPMQVARRRAHSFSSLQNPLLVRDDLLEMVAASCPGDQNMFRARLLDPIFPNRADSDRLLELVASALVGDAYVAVLLMHGPRNSGQSTIVRSIAAAFPGHARPLRYASARGMVRGTGGGRGVEALLADAGRACITYAHHELFERDKLCGKAVLKLAGSEGGNAAFCILCGNVNPLLVPESAPAESRVERFAMQTKFDRASTPGTVPDDPSIQEYLCTPGATGALRSMVAQILCRQLYS